MHPPLTLLCNSSNHGAGYLRHAIEEIASLFQGIRRVAFIPFALHDHRWLRTTLIEAALPASVRSATGAFAARYRRIMPHRRHKKAVVAVAHAMLVTAYHLLARQTTYQDPGSDYDDRRQAERARRRAIQPLERQRFRDAGEPAA